MCQFASFFVHDKAAKLPIEKRYLIGDLRSHSGSMELLSVKYGVENDVWREAEWTGNDARDLVVRANGNSSELMATVLGDFATRDAFLAYAMEKLPDGLTTLYLSYATVPEKIKLPDGLTTLYLSGARGASNLVIPKSVKVYL